MNEKEKALLELQKAKAKALSSHFKKASKHHEEMADDDEKCMQAHKAHAEHHEKRMGKAEDPQHEYHKASAAFHKSLEKMTERMHKREKVYAEHYKKMSEACESEEAKKVYELLGIEEEPLNKTDVTPTPAATSTPTTAAPTTTAAPAAEAPTAPINETIQKALDKKLTEAVDAAFERVLSSEDFGKRVDQAIAGKLLEKLGSSTVDTPVKTFPIPRTSETANKGNGSENGGIDTSSLDPEVAELVKFE